jgi:transglutaminase-like putative cysteine protease
MIRYTEIAPGNLGVLQTLARMQGMIHGSQGSSWVRWATGQIPPGPPLHRVGAIYEWVLRRMVYVLDGQAADSVPLEEELRSPEYLLAMISRQGTAEGDCDDFVLLTGALLVAHGIPARLVVTSAREDREFDHVFLEAWTRDGWLTMDGIHGQPLGWSVPASGVTHRTEVPL